MFLDGNWLLFCPRWPKRSLLRMQWRAHSSPVYLIDNKYCLLLIFFQLSFIIDKILTVISKAGPAAVVRLGQIFLNEKDLRVRNPTCSVKSPLSILQQCRGAKHAKYASGPGRPVWNQFSKYQSTRQSHDTALKDDRRPFACFVHHALHSKNYQLQTIES